MLQVWSISYRISMTSSLLYQLYQAILFWIRLSLYSDWHGVWAVFIISIFIIVIVSVVVTIIIIIIIVVVPIIIIVIILIIIMIIIIIVLLLLLLLSLLLLSLSSLSMRHNLCRSFHPWCPGVKNRCLCLTVVVRLSRQTKGPPKHHKPGERSSFFDSGTNCITRCLPLQSEEADATFHAFYFLDFTKIKRWYDTSFVVIGGTRGYLQLRQSWYYDDSLFSVFIPFDCVGLTTFVYGRILSNCIRLLVDIHRYRYFHNHSLQSKLIDIVINIYYRYFSISIALLCR